MNQKGWVPTLPFIDQGPLFEQFNPDNPAGEFVGGGGTLVGNQSAVGNDLVVSQALPVFTCPSDDNDTHYRGSSTSYAIGTDSFNNGLYPAYTNYDFNIWRSCTSFIAQPRNQRRMFGLHSSSKLSDAQDGSSNVVMLSETVRWVYDGVAPSWGVYKHVGDGVDFGAAATHYRQINEWWCCGWTSPPWDRNGQPGRLGEWGSPGSRHPGGCHVAMADGSIRFIAENIDSTTRIRLGRIADGQPVGDF